jgi:hypothetical protein
MARLQRDRDHTSGRHFRSARHPVRVARVPPGAWIVAVAAPGRPGTGILRVVPGTRGGRRIRLVGWVVSAHATHLAHVVGVRPRAAGEPRDQCEPALVAGIGPRPADRSGVDAVGGILVVVRRGGSADAHRRTRSSACHRRALALDGAQGAARRHAGPGARDCGRLRLGVDRGTGGESARDTGGFIPVRPVDPGRRPGVVAGTGAGRDAIHPLGGRVPRFVARPGLVRGTAARQVAPSSGGRVVPVGAPGDVHRIVRLAGGAATDGGRRGSAFALRRAGRSDGRRGPHRSPRCRARIGDLGADPHSRSGVRHGRHVGHARQPHASCRHSPAGFGRGERGSPGAPHAGP